MVKVQNSDSYGLKRLESKNARNAIIQKLAVDFNLTPLIAEAFYQQFSLYFQQHANVSLSSGEIAYEAVSSDEPAGRHIRLTRKKTIKLKLMDMNTDFEALANFGLAGLRRHRLERVTREAYDQGTLLTQLDLAMLLGVCDAVVSKYVSEIQKEGNLLPTRGNIHDLSGAITHKREIITLYLEGYLTPDIALKTNHSKECVDRYIKDYHKVEILWKHQIVDLDQISQLTRLSKRLVHQYVDLLPAKLKKSMSKNINNEELSNSS